MHLHAYRLDEAENGGFRLNLDVRLSTDTAGVATFLGLRADANVEWTRIVEQLETKISMATLFTV